MQHTLYYRLVRIALAAFRTFFIRMSLVRFYPPTPNMAIPAGVEPATYCLEGNCSIQLSYGTLFRRLRRNIFEIVGIVPRTDRSFARGA